MTKKTNAGIKALAAGVAAMQAEAAKQKAELENKLGACSKEIAGVACGLYMTKSGLCVRLGDGKEYDAEVFAYICRWFQKHYGQGDDTQETEPAADPE